MPTTVPRIPKGAKIVVPPLGASALERSDCSTIRERIARWLPLASAMHRPAIYTGAGHTFSCGLGVLSRSKPGLF
jgi:hypothetical protein